MNPEAPEPLSGPEGTEPPAAAVVLTDDPSGGEPAGLREFDVAGVALPAAAEEGEPTPVAPPPPTPWGLWSGFGLLFVGATLAAMTGPGWHDDYLMAALELSPVVLFAVLVHVGEKGIGGRVVALGYYILSGTLLLLALTGILFLAQFQGLSAKGPTSAKAVVPVLLGLGGLTISTGLVALAPGLPGVREWVSRFLPIRPDAFSHAIALSAVGAATWFSLGQLILTGGKPILLEMMAANEQAGGAGVSQTGVSPAGISQAAILFSFCWTGAVALAAAGFPSRRRLPDALRRLGLLTPTWKQTLGGLVLAGLLVVVLIPLDAGIGTAFDTLNVPRTDSKTFEKLLAPLMTAWGAVLIGVTAGVGEELVVRGALQPRLGIWLSNLFFTSLHAFQYGVDGLLVVFLVGLTLGVVRTRTNTTVCCLVHGTYDFILVLMEALGK